MVKLLWNVIYFILELFCLHFISTVWWLTMSPIWLVVLNETLTHTTCQLASSDMWMIQILAVTTEFVMFLSKFWSLKTDLTFLCGLHVLTVKKCIKFFLSFHLSLSCCALMILIWSLWIIFTAIFFFNFRKCCIVLSVCFWETMPNQEKHWNLVLLMSESFNSSTNALLAVWVVVVYWSTELSFHCWLVLFFMCVLLYFLHCAQLMLFEWFMIQQSSFLVGVHLTDPA